MARTRKSAPINTCIGYTRVSTDEQATSGAGLDAQWAMITAEAEQRAWTIVAWHTDEGVSGSKPADDRPAGHAALEAMRNRDAATLLVAKSDRLTRSVLDLAGLVARADREGWELTACDHTIDTSTPAGRFTTTIMGGVAELEREQIGARTREALAARRAAGVRLGRARVCCRPRSWLGSSLSARMGPPLGHRQWAHRRWRPHREGTARVDRGRFTRRGRDHPRHHPGHGRVEGGQRPQGVAGPGRREPHHHDRVTQQGYALATAQCAGAVVR